MALDTLKILDAEFLDFDTGSELFDNAMFDMFLSLLSYIAHNECEEIRERQRQGVLLAKQAGRYKGRPTEYSLNSPDPQKKLVYTTVVKLLKKGEYEYQLSPFVLFMVDDDDTLWVEIAVSHLHYTQ